MWNGSIKFIRKGSRQQNKNGFIQEEETYTESIPASFTDVTRNDEILAAQKGYTANRNIEVMECNYNGEESLLDESDNSMYDIKRTYRKDKAMKIIMTCERRQNGTI
ncbi:MAG: hypothetical protein K1W34_14165 [Lachnospiraceae bacterium]